MHETHRKVRGMGVEWTGRGGEVNLLFVVCFLELTSHLCVDLALPLVAINIYVISHCELPLSNAKGLQKMRHSINVPCYYYEGNM